MYCAIFSPLTRGDQIIKSNEGSPQALQLTSEIFENFSLHIDDVEFLHNAFIVQALSGFLIRFSNRGRYEPYIAKSWTHENNVWSFKLHPNLTCENGQSIDAYSFKKSLLRSFKKFSANEIKETPFINLQGINNFIKDQKTSDLEGLQATDNETLNFSFTKHVGKSFLEYLAMTPFAFQCDDNFINGQWKNKNQYISSGPYRILNYKPESNSCILSRRSDWKIGNSNKIQTIYINKTQQPISESHLSITMTYGKEKDSTLTQSNRVLEVPRALLSLRLGIGEKQYFSQRTNRQYLASKIQSALLSYPISYENYHKADSFFFGQISGHEVHSSNKSLDEITPPLTPLLIRAKAPGQSAEIDFYQNILFNVLNELSWPYKIIEKPVKTVDEFLNEPYDIAFDRSHVDATLDPDFVRILFKSKLGPQYQDPDRRISKLVDEFDAGHLPYRDFLILFNTIISEEAAIIPLFHRGFVWQFSKEINTHHISPLMSILRFDELIVNE